MTQKEGESCGLSLYFGLAGGTLMNKRHHQKKAISVRLYSPRPGICRHIYNVGDAIWFVNFVCDEEIKRAGQVPAVYMERRM